MTYSHTNDLVHRPQSKLRCSCDTDVSGVMAFVVFGRSPHAFAAGEHDSRESAKTAGVEEERNRRYDNNECFIGGKQEHKHWECP